MTGDMAYVRKIQYPERKIDQVNAQIDQTTSTGKLAIVKPGLVRPIGIVKCQFHREHVAKPPRFDELFDLANAFHESIRQVDTQEPIGSARRINYPLCFFQVASEGLLTENGYSTLESGDGLIRMQGDGGGNH